MHVSCRRRDWFTNFWEINSETIFLKSYTANIEKGIVLWDIYYVSNIRMNLISVSQVEKKGKKFLMRDGKAKIRNKETKKKSSMKYIEEMIYMY